MRGYIPVTLFLTLALPHAWRLTTGRARDRDAVAFAVFGALALWTHYLSILVLASLTVLAAWGSRRDRRALTRLGAALLGQFAAVLPLLPHILAHLGTKKGAGLLPDFGALTVTHLVGTPLGAAWVVLAGVLLSRPWRDPASRWLLAALGGFVALTLASSAVAFQVPMYSLPILAVLLLLVATALLRGTATWPPAARAALVAVVLALVALPSTLLPLVPSERPFVARVASPFYLRGVSHGPFAARITALRAESPERYPCPHLVASPAFDIETYLFYFGRLTLPDIGVEPFSEHGHMTFAIHLPRVGRDELFLLSGTDRMGDERPPEDVLGAIRRDLGCRR